MHTFRKPRPNVIESDAGTIRITGRAGLEVTYLGETVPVSSEMLAPPMSIALFVSGSDSIPSPNADQILEFVKEGLQYAGFTVEVQ